MYETDILDAVVILW